MKKLFVCLLVLALLGAISASALTFTEIPGVLSRENIPFAQSYPDNPVLAGISPTTGQPWEEVYAPVMMVLDNAESAYPHWGVKDADLIFQVPNAGKGATKLLALFSDRVPQAAGGSRSARTPFVDVARSWGAAFAYAGFPQVGSGHRASVQDKFNDGKMKRDTLSFNLLGGNNYAQRIKGYQAPHNLSADIAMIRQTALANGALFTQRPFLFGDTLPQNGPEAGYIEIRHFGETVEKGDGHPASFSSFTYDAAQNAYIRTNSSGPYVDRDEPSTALYFANVIVQRERFSYYENYIQLNHMEGTGAADIFIGGRYIAGGWYRDSLDSRTVFVDEKGQEITFLRGRTFIVLTNDISSVKFAPTAP